MLDGLMRIKYPYSYHFVIAETETKTNRKHHAARSELLEEDLKKISPEDPSNGPRRSGRFELDIEDYSVKKRLQRN